ncbi:hypothetical protein [Archangium violaceum]|uniref:hypothetical protein n=1 Tax=Archangium violaceum TaxID=83451 RepID=UPI0013636736|nr:hypothetical protein [Archangium violaceum]
MPRGGCPGDGAREALAELQGATAEAERIDSELFASDEAVRTAGEAHAMAVRGPPGA